MRSEISRRASEVFHADAMTAPQMTLRGGYAEDSYDFAPPPDPGPYELFDLDADPGAEKDLASDCPEIAEQLHDRLVRWLVEIQAPEEAIKVF